MDFWFEFLEIHMNEKKKTYHDCHGFKWKNINIYLILTVFLCSLTPFLVHWIVIAPKWRQNTYRPYIKFTHLTWWQMKMATYNTFKMVVHSCW